LPKFSANVVALGELNLTIIRTYLKEDEDLYEKQRLFSTCSQKDRSVILQKIKS
jgi:hypothetical protein